MIKYPVSLYHTSFTVVVYSSCRILYQLFKAVDVSLESYLIDIFKICCHLIYKLFSRA